MMGLDQVIDDWKLSLAVIDGVLKQEGVHPVHIKRMYEAFYQKIAYLEDLQRDAITAVENGTRRANSERVI